MKNHQRNWALCVGILILLAVAFVNAAEKIEMKSAEPGVYCRLTSAEMRERMGEIRAEFLVHVKGVDELEEGYRYWFEKTPERINNTPGRF